MNPFSRLAVLLLLCLPLLVSCSSSKYILYEEDFEPRWEQGGNDWSYPPGCSPPAHVKPMGLLQYDGFHAGHDGELWTTQLEPELYVILEEGDGYIPSKNDFAAYVDGEPVPFIMEGADKVSFRPMKPLRPGTHYASLIFWPPASYPQGRAVFFKVDTRPAVITSWLVNYKEGFLPVILRQDPR